jgi:hypothetical protein
MRQARALLPKAIFAINTNGDYLSSDLLGELEASGCNRISVSIYGPDHGNWHDEYISNRVRMLAKALGINAPISSRPGMLHSTSAKVGALALQISGRNLWKTGYDRGGLLPALRVRRSSPCLSPFADFLVDHRGYALPCCNVYTDRSEHLRYTIADMNVGSRDIFTAYGNGYSWRNSLLRFDPGGELCDGCSRGNDSNIATPDNRADLESLRQELGLKIKDDCAGRASDNNS